MEVFYMGNVKEMKLLMGELSISEKGLLFAIAPYVGFEDCCIKYTNGREMNIEQIGKLAGISERTAQEVVKSLIQKDILYKGKNSKTVQYFANPWIFCRRGKVNKVLRTMFKNYEIRTKNNVKWKDLKE